MCKETEHAINNLKLDRQVLSYFLSAVTKVYNEPAEHHSPCVLQAAAVSVTFAFGAFLAPPLEPASDQAVIGAKILCAIGKKGHVLVSTNTKQHWTNLDQIKLGGISL